MAKKNLFSVAHNPDVLSCLANLSNDEVFTPPDIANIMLDTLPQEIFQNKSTTFLDPACKSGVFLREIAKRLLVGIKDKIPDLRKRVDHIFHNQLFGLSITELTSLLSRRSVYCSKYPNSEYSVTVFDNPEGNIRFKKNEHVWRDDNCVFCGASKSVYDRDDALEFHAYEFIHTINPDEIFKMKFDVIVGNPPYQLTDSGHGKSAIPIYQHFVQQAIRLNPRYLVMIIPSRWFSGGKGLDNFRSDMLKDKHIRKLVDYENFRDVFPGVDLAGGACYFLRNRDEEGSCSVTNFYNGNKVSSERYLNEFDTFIRQNLAIDIVRKIRSIHGGGKFLDEVASSRKPFGLPTNYAPKEKGIPCWFIQRIGLKYASANDVADTNKYLNKWKLLLPIAPIAGQTDFTKPVGFYYDGNTIISKPGECCTESYFVANAFNSKAEVLSFKSYIFTKTARFLLLQAVVSQHVTKKNFCFVPDIGSYTSIFSDEMLRKKWKITDAEWDFIDSKISTIGGVANE
ncbi:MAG: Eco57I restriction-modification methylase domain-containing protein [Deltaproteobacteria bacterium]|jgi:site-specific DNA-methyltransferase (adenine-specific)|nr:Eco57I restriction-modification methylase domain-containing protein [Deltaproteobacteria bacterium]